MPPTADNLNDMSWQERRRLEQQRVNEECTPMTTAEAGSQMHPPYEAPRDTSRTLGNRSTR